MPKSRMQLRRQGEQHDLTVNFPQAGDVGFWIPNILLGLGFKGLGFKGLGFRV